MSDNVRSELKQEKIRFLEVVAIIMLFVMAVPLLVFNDNFKVVKTVAEAGVLNVVALFMLIQYIKTGKTKRLEDVEFYLGVATGMLVTRLVILLLFHA